MAYYGCAPDWVPDYAQRGGRTVLEQIAAEKARWRTDPRNPENVADGAVDAPDDVDPPDEGDEGR